MPSTLTVPQSASPVVAAVICAAGLGARAGGVAPKQFAEIGGRTMLRRAAEIFLNHPAISRVAVTIGPDQRPRYDAALGNLVDHPKLAPPAEGGATRQISVRRGLELLAADIPDIVLVHDAARPFASAALVDRAIEAAIRAGAAVPGAPVTDTICAVDEKGARGETLDRTRLRALQTPQAFRYADLLAAHRRAAEAGRDDFTDDGALFAWAGGKVAMFEGEARNVKMTTPDQFEDEALRRAGLAFLARGDVRTGTGFDVHAFGEGDHVMLGGVPVPHSAGLSGHSDADVALHALTDAILGALADGDIGAHFPPSDSKWKGADSALFLADAASRVRAAGGEIAHLDLTVIGEAPKVGPHRDAIRARISQIVGVPIGRVGVKATTTERLGFTGRREGLAALASATIRLPFRDEV
ncbi:bifunctional 2-C-methyl-D-erythritol 4-phosphate cytidylyltransferase/2-C-methyl-D-erythritol 2,4-cyclodiphosphate synthase [Chelatococcus sambhunathii]|uniref:Bifunctional enzyme IspD/IspF n=1 Tax=Chelatococcus sambhunathii TaxID=363953 RepID=A0ABU1DAP6_9HYPH|nr:bifunctional 2-C-methyl-D-erythritol 4-phosphate cytidylyltransferase/2-C-methyl-D-erythritol 2,4-cyclodiphosphate synthase [Chelatococcus sambhunathii]MDR4305147.1 bifunctional 2-C-methyl-D-erythritol 4-phosphate cytidylyltransferase/2-C-methyl-D-erythritol 2,4-cyclodiphosphate synthase [Chelatococcus sambhunathii]